MKFVFELESRPEVRQQVNVFANTAAYSHSGRVFLAETVPVGGAQSGGTVSVRATPVVRQILNAARAPIPWKMLAEQIRAETPTAAAHKIETILTQLWQQSLLLTDLRPPLTHEQPAYYVAKRLAQLGVAPEASIAAHHGFANGRGLGCKCVCADCRWLPPDSFVIGG